MDEPNPPAIKEKVQRCKKDAGARPRTGTAV